MGLKRVSWVRRYQGQCRALQPLGHQGYRLRSYKKDPPLCSGYTGPGVAGRSRKPSPSTHTHTARPSQEWRGTSGARTQAHTEPQNHSQEWRTQPKPEPKHTHPHRTSQPGVAGYKQSAHTSTHTPQHPSQEWRGAAKTRAQARTPQPGVAGYKRSAHTNTYTPTPEPGVAGRSRRPSPSTHTRTALPSQEWRGTSGARTQAHTEPQNHSQEWPGVAENRAQAHTPTPHIPARSGRVQAEGTHKHTHAPTP